jgi:signal peptidase II
MQTKRWPGWLFYGVAAMALVLDQATKALALTSLRPVGSVLVVPGLFNLTFVRNTGIAFGMFAGEGLLVALFMVGLAALALYQARSLNWRSWEPNVVGGGLVGGALGNLLDRARLGYVVDFLDFYVGPHHWPVFNIADSLICVSVAWIVVRNLRGERRS